MDTGSSPDPIVEELARAKRTSRRYWWREGLRISDFAEIAGGWSDLPRGGRGLVILLLVVLIMFVPIVGITVALFG